MRLDQAFDGIMDAAITKLEAATVEGALLADVKAVVRGDRHRTPPDTPTIWAFAETAQMVGRPTTIREPWTLPLALVAIVKSDDPEEGYNKASRLAALARHVMLRDADDKPDRRLGLDYVQDVKSGRFEPSGPWHREGHLFAAVAVVMVTFLTDD